MRQVPPSRPGEPVHPGEPVQRSQRIEDFGHWPWTAAARWRWIVGILGSWAIVWVAGPFVLDSILVRVFDPALGVATLRPGDVVRWRSEGWGNTRIGPHGLPGWQPRAAPHRIVLWGDSQVEGVCVDDPYKIHNQVIAIARDRWQIELDCLPMGRSGADARQWRELMDEVDALWDPVLHVWVVTDLTDLTSLAPPGALQTQRHWVQSPRWVKAAAALRAEAIFTAGKRMLHDTDTGGLRRLNFAVGPRATGSPTAEPRTAEADRASADQAQAFTSADTVAAQLIQLEQRFAGRLAILYAPATPTLTQRLATEHSDDAVFESIRDALVDTGIDVVDVRQDFMDLWVSQTRLPRGFHNGLPGYGHLNPDGNRVVARVILALARERLFR